jgi:hypothetical protein
MLYHDLQLDQIMLHLAGSIKKPAHILAIPPHLAYGAQILILLAAKDCFFQLSFG